MNVFQKYLNEKLFVLDYKDRRTQEEMSEEADVRNLEEEKWDEEYMK